MANDRLVSIYLNDHLAGATTGVELARRARSSNRGTRWGEPLEQVCGEIEADRATLKRVMQRLSIKSNVIKIGGAWLGEKLGRLKLNGRMTGYSPLSRLEELEMLHIGITGKLELWRALERTMGSRLAEFDLASLIERAESQRQTIEQLRLDAAEAALSP